MSAADGLAWNEEDGSAILSTLTIFWKAGRYKLAALVSKTRSAQRRGRSITDAFRQSSTTEVLWTTRSAHLYIFYFTSSFSWWSTAIAPHAAKIMASSNKTFPGKPQLTSNERQSHETRPPLSKPVALSPELQTKSYPPHQTSDEAALQLSPGALRSETQDCDRPAFRLKAHLTKPSRGRVAHCNSAAFHPRRIPHELGSIRWAGK